MSDVGNSTPSYSSAAGISMPISGREKIPRHDRCDSPSLSSSLTLVDRQSDARGFDHDIAADRIDRSVFTQFHNPVHVARSRTDDLENDYGVRSRRLRPFAGEQVTTPSG